MYAISEFQVTFASNTYYNAQYSCQQDLIEIARAHLVWRIWDNCEGVSLCDYMGKWVWRVSARLKPEHTVVSICIISSDAIPHPVHHPINFSVPFL